MACFVIIHRLTPQVALNSTALASSLDGRLLSWTRSFFDSLIPPSRKEYDDLAHPLLNGDISVVQPQGQFSYPVVFLKLS